LVRGSHFVLSIFIHLILYILIIFSYSDGFLTGGTALELFSRSGLDRSHLAKVWNLSDLDKDNQLNETEFMIAMHLIMLSMKGYDLPLVTPIELIHNIENGNRVGCLF